MTRWERDVEEFGARVASGLVGENELVPTGCALHVISRALLAARGHRGGV